MKERLFGWQKPPQIFSGMMSVIHFMLQLIGGTNSGKYKGKILEEYWVPNPDDTKLRYVPIDTIVWAWMVKKEHCKKAKINKDGVKAVLDLLE